MVSFRGAVLAAAITASCTQFQGTTEPIVTEDAAPPSYADAASEAEAEAGPAPAPPDAGPDDAGRDKRVFVTSDAWNGVMGGLSGADTRCVAAADRAELGGDWIAWISADGEDAIARIEHDGPYVRLDGARVVRNKAQLRSGILTVAIELTETGEAVAENRLVWTGTLENGARSADCNNWSTDNVVVFGAIGTLNRRDRGWTDNGGPAPGFRNWGCQTKARLYCFER
ncbi:MAG: hypothetical protein KIS78_21640 [Labilithrix sp.]|nr:hypothetical protein [Labilithrix sp.]MCW5835018.1 hypothetical protein [Labilithrix sp.]